MEESDPASTVRVCHSVSRYSDVGGSVKRRFHCGGLRISVLHCVGYGVDCPSVSWYKNCEYENDLVRHVQCFDGQPLSELGTLLVNAGSPFCHLSLSRTSIIGRVTETLHFVCLFMRKEHFLARITLNCSPSHRGIRRGTLSKLRLDGKSWSGLLYFEI